ncbi:carboxylate-amine ligase [Jatrophihabitans sp. DSM 45814]
MRRVGVEEELLLVDAVTGVPVPGYYEVAAEAERRLDPPAEHELKQEQAEIASVPHHSLAAVGLDLRMRRDALRAAAAERDLAVAATATSPVGGRATTTENERYQRMETRFGLLERQQLTCGMHVHVSISSPAEGVAILDRIRPWLSVLVAMSSNSPYWQGEDTGYASYRTIVWGQWPTAGPNELFGDADSYRELVDELLGSGTLLDEGMIYFDARLSRNYPTVEIRVADVCTSLEDGVTIAGLARALVETASAQASSGVPPLMIRSEVLRVASWGAARFGLDGDLVDPISRRGVKAANLLDQLLDHVRPALVQSGDLPSVEEGLRRMLDRGTGAAQQREAFDRLGELGQVALDVVSRTA